MNRPQIPNELEAVIEILMPHIQGACKGILVPRADNFTPPERTPWGGDLIPLLKARLGIEAADIVGESWEVSGHPSFPSLIPFELKGSTIEVPLWLIGRIAPEKLYGPANVSKFGENAPFLTKLLNSAHGHNLSIQIHPDATYAKKNHKWHSKTEMWVILNAEPGAGIYIGLAEGAAEKPMRSALTEGADISQYLNFVEVNPGDIFFLPAGTPHAIGGGLLLLEQQETSETTFRYYSWGDGRELHIKDALASTHWDTERGTQFVDKTIRRSPVVLVKGDKKTARHELLANEQEFSYDRVTFTATSAHEGDATQGMHGITITDGSLTVETAGLSFGPFPAGQSLIVPAAVGNYRLVASSATATAYIGRSDPRSERQEFFVKQSLIAQNIAAQDTSTRTLNDAFCSTTRPHALLITNHGYAGPTFPAGAPDSGGQITYVNQLAKLLAAQGYRVTIASRSFTPDKQFAKFGDRRGSRFANDEPFVRYVFVPDDVESFIPKEQIYDQLPTLATNLAEFIGDEAQAAGKKPWEYIAWINSHYVDAGTIGQLVVKCWMDEAGSNDPKLNKHAWTPHSLGKLKEQNMLAMDEKVKRTPKFQERLKAMNFETRESYERTLLGSSPQPPKPLEGCLPAAALVTTSAAITETFGSLDASSDIPLITFPPGTNISAYRPRKNVNEPDVQKLFAFLGDIVPTDLMKEITVNPQKFNIIVEAGRMDATKRKQIPIAAMTELPANTLLFVTGKRDKRGIYDALEKTIDNHGLDERVFLLGMVPDELMAPLMSLPHGENDDQFRLAIGVSASRMEGWGMAVMDMTAGGMPLVSSPLVPYAMRLQREDKESVVIVPLSDHESTEYAKAFKGLIDDPAAAREQAHRSHSLAQRFDWTALVKKFVSVLDGIIN